MATTAPLACTVRSCGEPLIRNTTAYRCTNGHSFDIARAGYVNLLQPQDRRSLDAGDSERSVDARARLIARGLINRTIDAVVDTVRVMPVRRSPMVAELGCGTGHQLDAIQQHFDATAVGIDLSTHAIQVAARRSPAVTWVVANADRRLPILDHSLDLLLSINARRNPPEAARVLRPDGRLLVAVPAEDDLIELRGAVQGEEVRRTRDTSLIDAHTSAFKVERQTTFRERHDLDVESLKDLLLSTYRAGRHSLADHIEALEPMSVTFAMDIVVFAPR